MIIKIDENSEYRDDGMSKGYFKLNDTKTGYETFEPTETVRIETEAKIAENDVKEALQAEKDRLRAEKEKKLRDGFITADGVMFFNEAFGYIFAETLSTALVLDEKTVTWKSASREQIDIDIETAKVYLKEIQVFLKSVHFVN